MDKKKSTYTGFTEARARANKKYMDKFVEVKVRMEPERRAMLQVHAAACGESVNGFINRAVLEAMERDNTASGVSEGRIEGKGKDGV